MKTMDDAEFQAITSIAMAEAGLSLPPGKRSFVSARLQRRLRATGMESFRSYVALVSGADATSVQERCELISALTTNVTGFFREPHHFAALARQLEHGRKRTACDPIRIWSAGCSSGEEALSIAATCAACLGAGWNDKARILATDIDINVLGAAMRQPEDKEIARRLADGVAAVLPKGMMPAEHSVASLKTGITYMRHNLLDRLPTSQPFDAIFCRNVTIYFTPDVQARVHAHLDACLAGDGLLFLGHSERLAVALPHLRLAGATTYLKCGPAPEGDIRWH
ncbi:protein-glutamate O-methyltransferase CheR [Jannaschia sp. 2305UL9-9]|uniref:CheR family methyltransferase n=1 Tax=Jannaschia sp. 2305UL9-9 TaxID=3121638 RepID=UPI003526E69B